MSVRVQLSRVTPVGDASEIFRKAVIARYGRKRTKNTRCSFHCNRLILGEVARPERFELPAFWFVARGRNFRELAGTEKNAANSASRCKPAQTIYPSFFTFSSRFCGALPIVV